MSKEEVNRRQFLQTSSLALAGIAVIGGAGTTLLVPTRAWALSTTTLDRHTAMTLVKMCRYLYPHAMLSDVYYANVVQALDKKAQQDRALAELLRDGVAALDAVYPVQWLELSDGYKLKALHHLEGTSFFQTVRSFMVGSAGLYNQPLVWRYFGYEGPAWEFGGYLDRGFDDIAWVPTE